MATQDSWAAMAKMFEEFGINAAELKGLDHALGGAMTQLGQKQQAVHDLVDVVGRSVRAVDAKSAAGRPKANARAGLTTQAKLQRKTSSRFR